VAEFMISKRGFPPSPFVNPFGVLTLLEWSRYDSIEGIQIKE